MGHRTKDSPNRFHGLAFKINDRLPTMHKESQKVWSRLCYLAAKAYAGSPRIPGFWDPGGGCLACIHLGAILICLCRGGQGLKIQDTCCSLNVLEIYFSKKRMTAWWAGQDGMCACELHLIESSEQQVKVFLSISVQREKRRELETSPTLGGNYGNKPNQMVSLAIMIHIVIVSCT